MLMSTTSKKILVVRNGTLIDGSGKPAARNDTIVIEGNRIKTVGAMPGDVELEDRRTVEVIDAGGQWIMPGLIDAHCHVSYGYPVIKGEGKGRGTTRPEFSTLKSARSVQKVLRSGVTGISVPGGTWFTDVGVRDAIKLGLMEGPRMYVAGRMIVTYGCIEDDEPSWEGTPDHSIGKLCNTGDEMVTEVRRQGKHGVNFIKMADSRSGESQMLAKEEIAAVVAEAHRRNLRVGIHPRRRRGRRRLDHSCRSRHRPRPRSRGQGRHADHSHRHLPVHRDRTRAEDQCRAGADRYQSHEAALRPALRADAQGAQARHQAARRHRYR
jgi:imidazolonepropionase-like amidohydrolase